MPSVSELGLPWDVVPPRRSAVAAGLRIIEAARCTVDNFQRCPDGRARRCGRHHPRDEPWIGLYVHDVAARVPAGQIVPMRFRRNSRSSDVLLVSKSSLELYEEMTGRLAGVVLSPVAEMVPATRPAGEVECRSEQPHRDGVILLL